MRADLMGHFIACMTDIYLHIDARMADDIATHPYADTRSWKCHGLPAVKVTDKQWWMQTWPPLSLP